MGGTRWLGGRASDSEPRCPCSSIIKGAVLYPRARRIHFQQALGYALAISNHGPHPPRQDGGSRGNKQGFNKSYETAVRGKYPGFTLYRRKVSQDEMKNIAGCDGGNTSGFINEQTPQGGAFSGDCSCYSPGWGRGYK